MSNAASNDAGIQVSNLDKALSPPIAAPITMMSRRPPSKACSPLAAVAHLGTIVVAVFTVIRSRS